MLAILIVLLGLGPLPAHGRPAPPVGVDVPPGWEDVTANKDNPDVLLALKGPQTSSFVLTRMDPVDVSNRAVVRNLLINVLSGVNRQTQLGFIIKSNLMTASYQNELTAYYIQAELRESAKIAPPPKLVVALLDGGGQGPAMLATLMSAAPEAFAQQLLGSLKLKSPATGAFGAPAFAGSAESGSAAGSPVTSRDGQFSLLLPGPARARPLDEREKEREFVLAIKGADSELMVMRVPDRGATAREESLTIQSTLLALKGVDPASVTAVRTLTTSPGPAVVYAQAVMADNRGKAPVIAGFMPWCYWGYTIFAKGPAGRELLERSFQGLALGPSAVPKLVAATPRIAPQPKRRKDMAALAAFAALALLGALALRLRKR